MKSLKKLLIPLIILVVLILAVVIVVIVNKKGNDENNDGPYHIVDLYMDDVKSLRVDRIDKEPLIVNSSVNSDGVVFFTLEGDSQLEETYSQNSFYSFLTIMLDYNADSKIDAANLNLADYGLENPKYKVTISTKSGETKVIYLGNDTVSGGKCYVMIEGDNSIYTVANMKKTLCNYDSISFYNSVNLGINFKDVSDIVFERSYDNLKLECTAEIYETGEPVFNISEPIESTAGAYLTTLLKTVGALDITTFVKLSDEELQKVDLDNPVYHFSFTMKSGVVTDIYLSALTDGLYYGRGSFSDDYFILSSQQLKYIDAPIMDLINPYVHYFTVTEVKKIDCTYGDTSFEFTIETVDKISSEDARVLLNGRNAKIFNSSKRCYAAILFESLACIDIGGVEMDANPVLENPVLSFKIIDVNFRATEIAFVERDTSSYYCFINGEYSNFYVYARELFNDGGLDTYQYGIIPAYELTNEAIDNNLNGIYDITVGDS